MTNWTETKMIEENENQKLQQYHMEAALLLAEASLIATRLGFTLYCSGGDISVGPYDKAPLKNEIIGDAIFTADYITNLID